jgi:hypothetical protein
MDRDAEVLIGDLAEGDAVGAVGTHGHGFSSALRGLEAGGIVPPGELACNKNPRGGDER